MALVGFFGSRSLSPSRTLPSSSPLVSRVVASVLASGRGVSVGCASGGDALALSAALATGSSPVVFAVGGPSGAGFWRGSALALAYTVVPHFEFYDPTQMMAFAPLQRWLQPKRGQTL